MLSQLALVAILLPLFVLAKLVLLDDNDGTIDWRPSVMSGDGSTCQSPDGDLCHNVWWQEPNAAGDGGTFHNTWGGVDIRATFKFRGGSFAIYGTRYAQSAVGLVLRDGIEISRFNTEAATATEPQYKQELIRMDTGSDSSKEYTITIVYDEEETAKKFGGVAGHYFLGIDSIEIDQYEDSQEDPNAGNNNTDSDTTTTTTTTTTRRSGGPTNTGSDGKAEETEDKERPEDTGSSNSHDSLPTPDPNAGKVGGGDKAPPEAHESNKALKTGLIIGGIAVGAIVVAVAAYTLCKSRIRRAKDNADITEMLEKHVYDTHPFAPYEDDEAPDAGGTALRRGRSAQAAAAGTQLELNRQNSPGPIQGRGPPVYPFAGYSSSSSHPPPIRPSTTGASCSHEPSSSLGEGKVPGTKHSLSDAMLPFPSNSFKLVLQAEEREFSARTDSPAPPAYPSVR